MGKYKLSIITVCLNSYRTIEQTIKSVLKQKNESIEYIIIDGGSSDGTVDVIKRYEDELSYWVSEPDDGLYYAMNKGISASTGDIIGIINSDDWYEEGVFSKVISLFDSNGDVDVIAGQCKKILNNHVVGITHASNMEEVWIKWPFSHPSTFVTRNAYKRYGVFDTSYKIVADYDLFIRMYSEGAKFLIFDEAWTNYRITGISSQNKLQRSFENSKVRNAYADFCLYREQMLQRDCEQLNSTCLCEAIENNLSILCDYFRKINLDSAVVFGCGFLGKIVIKYFNRIGIRVVRLYDNDKELHGKIISGMEVLNPCNFYENNVNVVIAVLDAENEKKIEEQIVGMGCRSCKFISIESICNVARNYYQKKLERMY